jgi:hypothetical protein
MRVVGMSEQPITIRWLSIGAEVHDPAPSDPFVLLQSRIEARRESFLVRLSDETAILGTYVPDLNRWRVCAELADGRFLYLRHVAEDGSAPRTGEEQLLSARQVVTGVRALTDEEGMIWVDEN